MVNHLVDCLLHLGLQTFVGRAFKLFLAQYVGVGRLNRVWFYFRFWSHLLCGRHRFGLFLGRLGDVLGQTFDLRFVGDVNVSVNPRGLDPI